jgi:hypothetical protein
VREDPAEQRKVCAPRNFVSKPQFRWPPQPRLPQAGARQNGPGSPLSNRPVRQSPFPRQPKDRIRSVENPPGREYRPTASPDSITLPD